LGIKDGLEIHHDGDLPARAGLGSSSSFTVGLLHSLNTIKGVASNKKQLALDAIEIEQSRLKENVGSQDQVAAAFGGLNRIDFASDGNFNVQEVSLSKHKRTMLEKSLMLFFTGTSRIASEIAVEQINATPDKNRELNTIYHMVKEAENILCSNASLLEFGRLLHESWKLKKQLSKRISNPYLDEIYTTARTAGAIGGKLLGAGGGGFMLFFVPLQQQPFVKEALKKLLHVPFRLESDGSQILFSESEASSKSNFKGIKT
jgi:D-glycero-alpha-D-manno-heptose-7-phosphate kinase